MTKPRKWLERAEEDRKVAKLAYNEGIYNQTCFHCQQGAEKAMKAFLLGKSGRYPKTHFLVELFELCKAVDESFSGLFDECIYLDQFYVPTRYPDAVIGSLPGGLPGKIEAEQALAALNRVFEFIERKLA